MYIAFMAYIHLQTFPLHAGSQKRAEARAQRAAAADPVDHGVRAANPVDHGVRAANPVDHGLRATADMRRLRPGKRSTR